MAIEQLQKFTNNATTTVPSTITNVATSITVATGTGALFPSLAGSEFFISTIVNTNSGDPGFGQMEIVKVTARSGDVLTVVRGQEGTSGTNFPSGCLFELRPTAQAFNNIYTEVLELDTIKANLASPTFTGDPKAPTPSLGDNDTSLATTAYVQTAFNTYGDRHVNMVINPHGSIRQESTAAQTTTGAYVADQWAHHGAGSGFAWEMNVVSGGVSSYDPSNMYIKTTTAKASLAAGDKLAVIQPIEGNCVRRLLYGGASARGSWIRWRASASQSGTASIALRNVALARSFVQSFAVTTTPTDYSLFIPGDTTGTWVTDNNAAVYLTFCFASGTTFQTSTLGAWQAGDFVAANTQSNMLDTVNRQLNITDVQWNDAPILLPFQTIDYQQELARAQRYLRPAGVSVGQCFSATNASTWQETGINLRTQPTIITTAGWVVSQASGASSAATVTVGGATYTGLIRLDFVASSLVAGNAVVATPPGSTAFFSARM